MRTDPRAVVSGNHQLWFMPPDGIGRAQNSPCLASFHVHFKKGHRRFPQQVIHGICLDPAAGCGDSRISPGARRKIQFRPVIPSGKIEQPYPIAGKKAQAFGPPTKFLVVFRIRFHGTDGGKPTASVAQEFLYRVAVIRTQVHIGFRRSQPQQRGKHLLPGTNGGRQIFYLTGELIGNQIPVDLPATARLPKGGRRPAPGTDAK